MRLRIRETIEALVKEELDAALGATKSARVGEQRQGYRHGTSSWDNGRMPNATITVDAALKAGLADIAGKTGQSVDEFVEALLRRIAGTDVAFERGVPVFPRRRGAPTLTVADVDRPSGRQRRVR